jgi:transcriptional regulator with XRE-family HTH domain
MKKTDNVTQLDPKITRIPWTGGLDKAELSKPGGLLLAMLIFRANELGHKMHEMASELGVTYGYVIQLREGIRQVKNVSDEFAKACALYLGVPRLTVLLASGKITPEDLFENPFELVRALPQALRFIQKDPELGGIMPVELFQASEQVQFFVVALYEAATHKKLLPGKVDHLDLAKQVQEFNSHQALLRHDVEIFRNRNVKDTEPALTS